MIWRSPPRPFGYPILATTCHSFAAILADGSLFTRGDPLRGGHLPDPDVPLCQHTDTAFAALCRDATVCAWGTPATGGDLAGAQPELHDIVAIQATLVPSPPCARMAPLFAGATQLAEETCLLAPSDNLWLRSSVGLRGTLSRRHCVRLGRARHWRCTARATRHRRYPSKLPACLGNEAFWPSMLLSWLLQTMVGSLNVLRLPPLTSFSPWFRKVVYGAKFHLHAHLLQRLWVRAVKLYHKNLLSWTNAFGTTMSFLRRTLKNLKWREQSRFVWTSAHGTISLGTPVDSQDENLHFLRNSWREKQFCSWLKQKRREPQQMLDTYTEAAMVSFFRQINFQTLRSLIKDNVWYRHVALGAVVSPAAFAIMKQSEDLRCPFCNYKVGHWDHLAWGCPRFALGRPPKPRNPLTARFGWPLLGSCKNEQETVLRFLSEIVVCMIGNRHGSVPDN